VFSHLPSWQRYLALAAISILLALIIGLVFHDKSISAANFLLGTAIASGAILWGLIELDRFLSPEGKKRRMENRQRKLDDLKQRTYAATALMYGVFGAIGGVVAVAALYPDLPLDAAALFVIVAAGCAAFVGVSNLANKRHEYPLLAAADIAFNGAGAGFIVFLIAFSVWLHLSHTRTDRPSFETYSAIALVVGAAVNLGRRFGGLSFGKLFDVAPDVMGRTQTLLVGLYWTALGLGTLWVAWDLTSGILLYFVAAFGIYWLAQGLGPISAALRWSSLGADTHGQSRTATEGELRAANLMPHRDGIYLGLFLDPSKAPSVSDRVEYSGEAHLVSVGRPGSGKGTGLIIPNLSTLRRSILIIDPKGEAAAVTARKREQFGRVVILNPFNILTEARPWLKSEGFNPLSTVRWDEDNFSDDCTIIAQSLVKQERGNNGRFFSGSAHELVTALVMYELLTQRKSANLANVRRILTEEFTVDPDTGAPKGLARALEAMSLSKFEPLRDKATRFKDVRRSNQDIISTAINETRFIDSPPVGKDLASPTSFSFADMKKEIVTVYLILPATHLESHSNWLRLIIASALRELLSTPPSTVVPPVLFMLDEFAQLDHLPTISNAMNIARGYGIQLWPFVQDLNQLKDIYEDKWENFVGASSALTAFAPRDVFTSDYLSRLSGNKTIIVERESDRTSGGSARSRGPESVPLFRPEELRAMPYGQMLCFVEPVKRPFMVHAPGYWNTSFNEGVDQNPYRPA
jgi:type IV secretion system protein VirD4